jgi:hypothetical protein
MLSVLQSELVREHIRLNPEISYCILENICVDFMRESDKKEFVRDLPFLLFKILRDDVVAINFKALYSLLNVVSGSK